MIGNRNGEAESYRRISQVVWYTLEAIFNQILPGWRREETVEIPVQLLAIGDRIFFRAESNPRMEDGQRR